MPLTRSDMDHTVLPANNTMSAFTPQSQSITAFWPVLIAPTHEGMARLRSKWRHRLDCTHCISSEFSTVNCRWILKFSALKMYHKPDCQLRAGRIYCTIPAGWIKENWRKALGKRNKECSSNGREVTVEKMRFAEELESYTKLTFVQSICVYMLTG